MAGFSLKKKIGNLFGAVEGGVSRAIDQVNPLDNGRTWQQRTPTQTKSAFQQAGQVGGQFARATIPAIAQGINTGANQINQLEATRNMLQANALSHIPGMQQKASRDFGIANANAQLANAQFQRGRGGLLNTGTFYNADEARRGDLSTGFKRIGGGTAQAATEAASLLTGAPVGQSVTKLGVVQGIKAEVPNLAKTGLINTLQGGITTANQGGSAKDIATNALASGALGTAGDVGLGVVGTLVPKVTIKSAKGAAKGAKAVADTMEPPAVLELRARNDFLQKTFDTAPESVRKELNKQIANNNAEIRGIKEGGYAKNPFYDKKNNITEGLSKEQADFINEYANMIEGMGQGNGVAINPETGAKMSNNVRGSDLKGKSMTKADWFDEARKQIESGKGAYGASEDYKALPGIVPQVGKTNSAPVISSAELVTKVKNTLEPPTLAGKKTRKFQDNISRVLPDNPTAKEVVESMPGYKPITNKQTLSKAADSIAENPQREFARVVTKPQLTSANDVATGNLLLRDAIEKGDVETAVQLGAKLGIDGTKLGQAVQAYATFKKTTPEGIVTYASKKAMRAGKELDQATASQLIDQAKAVAQMEEGLDKAKATRDLLSQANSVGRDWKNTVAEVLAAPRSAMATADLSAPLRQGAVLGTRYPKQFGAAFADSIKYFASPKLFEKEMYDISQRSTYPLMKKSRLAVEGANGLTGTEEMFMNSILEGNVAKKLGFGHLVAASDRAYSGFLTKLRADVFDKVVSDFNSSGVKLDAKATDSLAKFINSASGRGSGKMLDKHGNLLAQVLFSPKLWKSRIDTMNPAYYARLDPVARKLALQSAAAFTGTAATILSLAAMSGAKVEQDPRSADFGKIRVGDTRYDILGGHQQNIRLAAQLLSGQKINSVTGQVQTLGPDRGFGKPSRLDLAYQFVENKENPVVALATKALRGTDQTGNPINLASEAAKLAIPLNLQSTWETARNVGSLPKGIAMNVPGTFGVGVQTYGKEKAPAGAPVSVTAGGKKYGLEQRDDGKYSVTLGDKVITRDSLKDAREVIAKDSFRASGAKSKIVGDMFYYKTKSGDIKSQPKVLYESKQNSAKNKLDMDRAYGAKNMSKWVASAQNEIDNLVNKQNFYDPITEKDEVDKIQLQIENLKDKAVKYASRGMGGSSGRGGGKSVNIAYTKSPISVSVKKPTAIKKPNVRVAVKARSSGGKGGKIKVTSKKLRLA